jgi:beta-galactosidase/beta-glucuronidase
MPPTTPRPEYPRPQFQRADWINLNGPWTFTFDHGRSGLERGLMNADSFEREITVPFCPESALSGVGHTDFIEAIWYQRRVEIPAGWQGRQVILHFGGVDYECEAFIDGHSVGRHYGGSVSFNFDVTRFVTPGQSHNLIVYARDDVRAGDQPAGKQSDRYHSHDCHYTRTTGIWQTVWMEAVDFHGLKTVNIVPDLDESRFILTPTYYAVRRGLRLRATVRENSPDGQQRVVSMATVAAVDGLPLIVPVSHPRPWSPESPFLYDLDLEVIDADERVLDRVAAYGGLRKIHIEGNRIFLNNQPIYLRMVLDQGFYPDGIWTAPSDEALCADIELSMRAGFNGARLHQKVFEARFHYWADRLGYLTWGESPSWGVNPQQAASTRSFLTEWQEIVCRDRSHPSIIAWTPFNETWETGDRRKHDRTHIEVYNLTRALDPTRPVNTASGGVHARTDLWTAHSYEQSPEKLRDLLRFEEGQQPYRNFAEREADYEGQPYLLDEFGGIKWIPEDRRPFADDSWGYGQGPKSLEEFYTRLEGQVKAIRGNENIAGFCYTQLTDVEQEQNGIYNYDRTEKFDMDKIAAILRLE